MKTESITSTRPISEEPKYTCSVPSSTQVWLIWADSTPSLSLAGSTDGLGITEILISKLIFLKFLPEKSFKSSGMELPFSSEDSPLPRSTRKKINTLNLPFSIKSARSASTLLVTPRFWCAQLFAPTWDVFLFPTWEPTTDGCAFVTVQFTTRWVESVKVLPCWTCHTLTTLCTRTALFCALKN